jgi:phosphonate transport system permease protein
MSLRAGAPRSGDASRANAASGRQPDLGATPPVRRPDAALQSAELKTWRRFTPAQRLARFAVYLALVAAIVASAQSVEIIPEFLYDAPEQMQDLLARMWPIAFYHYPQGVHDALMDTLHIASLGTILAVIMALPIGLLAANNVTPNRPLNYFAKLLLVSSRSVNSLVWALLFVAVFGPGALAGTLAIAFRSIGFVGKLTGEALEEANRGTIEALQAAGAPWSSVLAKGYWPQVEPAFWSVVLFRWDINVRESAVLGLVGAGGIGMALDTALNLFQWDRVAMVLFAIFTVVIVAEVAVTYIRKHVI